MYPPPVDHPDRLAQEMSGLRIGRAVEILGVCFAVRRIEHDRLECAITKRQLYPVRYDRGTRFRPDIHRPPFCYP